MKSAKAFERRVGALEPARGGERRRLEPRLDLVFGLQPADEHLELQLADHADDPLRADLGVEHLDHALFAEVVERLAQLLGLGRVLAAARGAGSRARNWAGR